MARSLELRLGLPKKMGRRISLILNRKLRLLWRDRNSTNCRLGRVGGHGPRQEVQVSVQQWHTCFEVQSNSNQSRMSFASFRKGRPVLHGGVEVV